MKVIEHIDRAAGKSPLFSYEIVPPSRGSSAKDIVDVVEKLAVLQPPWIDVTSHSSSAFYQEKQDGTIQKRTLRKRPGMLGICGIIQNRFKIDTVAHMLCLGFSKEETEDALIELNFLGVENILALRGDAPNFSKPIRADRTMNILASDLVNQVRELRNGQFLDDLDNSSALNFCVGVAGYPEKHFEAPSLKLDIQNLKKKVDAGADYVVTQMFFDNKKYFEFVGQCRDEGITVPIIPGLKMLKSEKQLRSIPKNFYIDIPDELVDQVTTHPKQAAEHGKNWMKKQVQGLLDANVPYVHFYVLNNVDAVTEVVKSFR
ncbi:methylenetetrahydrofolate reductase [NAD(P)H] [Bdellovibrio sp. qaytius]|nr:methylenetetrahydrofolate reductase [NAD(P)H] [Bdellovibrio sp. qaytius]